MKSGRVLRLMKRSGVAVAGLALALLATAISAGAGRAADEKDRAAMAQTVEQFESAWNKHDAHAFAMTFTEDADFTNVVGAHVQGRGNVEAFHAPIFAGRFKDTHQTGVIRSIRFLRADLAAVDVEWEMTGLKGPDGSALPDRKGLLNWVMARQGDGTWLIQIMHNTELTNAPAAPK